MLKYNQNSHNRKKFIDFYFKPNNKKNPFSFYFTGEHDHFNILYQKYFFISVYKTKLENVKKLVEELNFHLKYERKNTYPFSFKTIDEGSSFEILYENHFFICMFKTDLENIKLIVNELNKGGKFSWIKLMNY